MDWNNLSDKPHKRSIAHDGRLSSLPSEWERELAALWRLEADVNNGGYLQFLGNWGRESYVYAVQGLKKIGASRMVQIVEQCQALVDEHASGEALSYRRLLKTVPKNVSERVLQLSYEFMDYPDDIAQLGIQYYGQYFDDGGDALAAGYSPDNDSPLALWSPEAIARAAEADARITDRKCEHCGKPCPSYRKTCKYCGKKVSET